MINLVRLLTNFAKEPLRKCDGSTTLFLKGSCLEWNIRIGPLKELTETIQKGQNMDLKRKMENEDENGLERRRFFVVVKLILQNLQIIYAKIYGDYGKKF